MIATTGRVLDVLRRGLLDVSRVRMLALMECSALAGTSDFRQQVDSLLGQLVPSLKQVRWA